MPAPRHLATVSRCIAAVGGLAPRCIAALFALTLPALPAHAQARDDCGSLLTAVRNHIVNSSVGERTIRLENRDCRLDARLRGEVTYTADFRGIAAVSPGGSFRIEEDSRDARRRIDIENDGRGGVTVDYRVGRDVAPFDAAAQDWLADRLLLLYRRAGLAAQQRADWLQRSGDVDAVLREAALVQSSSARAIYLAAALDLPGVDEATIVRVLRSELPTSSSARTRVLTLVADRHRIEGRVADAYLDAVAATSSSSSQRALLERPLRDGRAPAGFAVRALRTASGISSSSARVSVLRAVAGAYAFDDTLLDAYLDAARGISSSSGQRDVLTAALREQQLSEPQLARTLRAVGSIGSSSAQGDILVQVARSRRLDGAARAAYVDVALAISSSAQRARVLEALERGPAR